MLVYVGSRVVLGSSDGKIVKSITDPAAPGWEATVDPTPVMALALVNAQGQLDSVSVMALTGEENGSVVTLSSSTVMGVPGVGNVPLSIVYGTGGIDLLREGLQGILGVGVPEIDVVEPTEWADLVGPVAPLQVSNPDPVMGVQRVRPERRDLPEGLDRPFGRAGLDVSESRGIPTNRISTDWCASRHFGTPGSRRSRRHPISLASCPVRPIQGWAATCAVWRRGNSPRRACRCVRYLWTTDKSRCTNHNR